MTDKTPNPDAPEQGGFASSTDIMHVMEHNPVAVILDEASRDRLYAHIEAEADAFVPDMTTAKGRDECRALAAKITRTKTTVDKARLEFTEEARQKIKDINEEGGKIKERLQALSDKVRQPLTDWETAEETRQTWCKGTLDKLRDAAVVPMHATSESLNTRIGEVEAVDMSETQWQGMLELAEKARATALEALTNALAIITKREEEAAELERLRQAEQDRLAREAREAEERAAQEAAEREERERAEREAAEAQAQQEVEETRQREETERATREAEDRAAAAEQAAQEAESRAREEERQRAEAAAAEQQRQHDEALAAERRRAEEAEATAAEERRQREAEEAERVRQEQAAADERARLEADQNRRTLAKTDAKNAIMTVPGVTEEMARSIILLIISGEVPRCFLDFAAEPKVKVNPEKPEGAML